MSKYLSRQVEYAINKNLYFLQRSIRPQVVTTFELPGCLDMWTVCGPQVKDPEDADEAKEEDEEVINLFIVLLIFKLNHQSKICFALFSHIKNVFNFTNKFLMSKYLFCNCL